MIALRSLPLTPCDSTRTPCCEDSTAPVPYLEEEGRGRVAPILAASEVEDRIGWVVWTVQGRVDDCDHVAQGAYEGALDGKVLQPLARATPETLPRALIQRLF